MIPPAIIKRGDSALTPSTEDDLAALAAAIAGSPPHPDQVRHIGSRQASLPFSDRGRDIIRAIAGGDDPLGDAFCRLRPAGTRRQQGAVYTPRPIVESMIAWAAREGTPSRVVDPGAGSGRFLFAAGRAFPVAQLLAVESDPLAALLLRANAARSLRSMFVRVGDHAIKIDQLVEIARHDVGDGCKTIASNSSRRFVDSSDGLSFTRHFAGRDLDGDVLRRVTRSNAGEVLERQTPGFDGDLCDRDDELFCYYLRRSGGRIGHFFPCEDCAVFQRRAPGWQFASADPQSSSAKTNR